MKLIQTVQRLLAGIACLGLLMPAQIMASGPLEPTGQAIRTHDILLHGGNVLAGQVVDPQGQPCAAVPVSLQHQGYEVARVDTDENGYFAVRGVRTGVYTLQAASTVGSYRAWPATIAPPAANPGALLVTHAQVVRGQCEGACNCAGPCTGCGHAGVLGGGGLFGGGFGLSSPLVIGAIMATAIAVPLAVQNDNSPGS
jgi:hypothetical protein